MKIYNYYIRFKMPKGYPKTDMYPYLDHLVKAQELWNIRRKRKRIGLMAEHLSKELGCPIVDAEGGHWLFVSDQKKQESLARVARTGGTNRQSVAVENSVSGEKGAVPEALLDSGPTTLVKEKNIPLVAQVERLIDRRKSAPIGIEDSTDMWRYNGIFFKRRARKWLSDYALERIRKECQERKV